MDESYVVVFATYLPNNICIILNVIHCKGYANRVGNKVVSNFVLFIFNIFLILSFSKYMIFILNLFFIDCGRNTGTNFRGCKQGIVYSCWKVKFKIIGLFNILTLLSLLRFYLCFSGCPRKSLIDFIFFARAISSHQI